MGRAGGRRRTARRITAAAAVWLSLAAGAAGCGGGGAAAPGAARARTAATSGSGVDAAVAPRATSATPRATPSPAPPVPDRDIARLMIVGFDARTPRARIHKIFADLHLGGIYLTGTTDAVAAGFTPAFYASLSRAAGAPLLVASDEEGGYVHRLRYRPPVPSAKQMNALPLPRIQAIAERAARQMRQDGITVDLAPVLDIDNERHDGAISGLDRSFAARPAVVSAKAGAFARGLALGGITPVAKHFPGIGHALPNSNTDLHKAVTPGLAALRRTDLVPFVSLIRRRLVGAVMVGNAYVPGLDARRPASISPPVIRYLRRAMGFAGLITTDDLTALRRYDGRTPAANIAASVAAGVDAPLFGFTSETDIRAAIATIRRTVPAVQLRASLARLRALEHTSR